LAIQLARDSWVGSARRSVPPRDGVWWIRLEELDKDTGSVAQSIAQVLSVRGDAGRAILETMCEQLRDNDMLLVLDNCEHLLADCARVCEQLLHACPQIKILATSRERLHIAGEVVFGVPPLPMPAERAQTAALHKSEAVKFFLHYARYARGDFALRAANAPAVAQICRRLDGLPLALELAAARVKTFSVEYIAEHLDERFELLAAQHRTIARHQTLRAVLDWSYELLDDAEKRVFAALSVFAARFTLDAAQSVMNGGGAHAHDILESLADKSLVLVEFDTNDAVRYRLLETIREYAREKLAVSPELLAMTNERLSKYYLQFSQQHAKNYLAIEDEWNNIATGMSIAHERQDWQPLLEYGQSVTDALFARGLYTDARRIIPWVITAADREEEQERSLQALYNWGVAYIRQACYDDARQIMTRLMELSEMARDEGGKAMAYFGLGWIAVEESDWEKANQWLEKSHSIRSKIKDAQGLAEVLLEQSRIEFRRDKNDQAQVYVLQALALLEPLPPSAQTVYGFERLSLIARDRGDYGLATRYCEQAIAYAEKLQIREEVAMLWYLRGQIAQASGHFQDAAFALDQSRTLFAEIGVRKTEAYVLDLLGGVLAELNRLAEAEHVGRMALEFLKQVGDEQGIIASSRRLGITLAKMNRVAEACALWREALVCAERTNDMRVPYLNALLTQYCVD
jgi:predicted ATPase